MPGFSFLLLIHPHNNLHQVNISKEWTTNGGVVTTTIRNIKNEKIILVKCCWCYCKQRDRKCGFKTRASGQTPRAVVWRLGARHWPGIIIQCRYTAVRQRRGCEREMLVCASSLSNRDDGDDDDADAAPPPPPYAGPTPPLGEPDATGSLPMLLYWSCTVHCAARHFSVIVARIESAESVCYYIN